MLDQSTFRPEIWQVIYQDAAETDIPTDDESILPVYEPPSRSLTLSSSFTRGDRSLASGLPLTLPSSCSTLYCPRSFLQMEPHETFTYTYDLFVNNTPVQIFILVESEPDRPNHYTFSLSTKIGHVERGVSTPVTMKLSIDPRRLDFVVFAFPPRSSLPTGCLHRLRVWLRTAGADHRIFAEQDLWIGKDPDFGAITDASFAYLRNSTQDVSIYQSMVGRAHVSFIFRWTLIEPETYALSLDYEAGGAGRTLFDNYQLRLYCEPQSVSFVIYSIPVPSNPTGASHRLRIWLRTPHASPHSPPSSHSHSRSHSSEESANTTSSSDSYLYHRLWKSDDFKIGAHLDFQSAGSRIVIATAAAAPSALSSTSVQSQTQTQPMRTRGRRVSRLVAPPHANGAVDGGETGETLDVC